MDDAGIDKAVLALTSPGVQSMFDLDEARGIAARANDHLAAACERHPDRFIGMTAICPQDAEWSAQELKRGKEELGFVGVQVNSHTHGHYLDEEQFDPILRAFLSLNTAKFALFKQGLFTPFVCSRFRFPLRRTHMERDIIFFFNVVCCSAFSLPFLLAGINILFVEILTVVVSRTDIDRVCLRKNDKL